MYKRPCNEQLNIVYQKLADVKMKIEKYNGIKQLTEKLNFQFFYINLIVNWEQRQKIQTLAVMDRFPFK